MGIESSKIKIVVNRFVKKGWDIEPDEVERALGLKISWSVPNDFKNAIAAINYGEPVVLRAPRSEMSVSLAGLAATFATKVVTKAA
jgi:Flp pilus assembly CpaE family ATPase